MLCISLMPGDYFVIGDDSVIQYDRLNGERVHLTIHAPREVPVVRGEVLERQGGKRPNCVMSKSPRYIRQLAWNHQKKQALTELREIVEQMGSSTEAKAIAEKLDYIFPRQDNS